MSDMHVGVCMSDMHVGICMSDAITIAAELMLWWVQAYFEDEPPFNN